MQLRIRVFFLSIRKKSKIMKKIWAFPILHFAGLEGVDDAILKL